MNSKDIKVVIPVIKEAASWGPDDPHIPKFHALAKEIAKHLALDDAVKDEVDFFADRMMDKLESALMYYQLIMADDFESRNISQKRTLYEGLYANLWSLYKGRVQNYIMKMGWDIAFVFCKDRSFTREAKKFLENNPAHKEALDFIKLQRGKWQTDFAKNRNIAEHTGDYRDGTNSYEAQEDAKRLFTQVCWTAETLIAYFGSYKMERSLNVTEINPAATIFDRSDRYIVEHAIMTSQRQKESTKEAKK